MGKFAGYFVLFLLIFGFCFFLYWRFRKNFKILNLPNFALFTGGIKTGKSELACATSHGKFKSVHRKWTFSKWFCKVFHIKFETEEPLFYTNGKTSFGSLHSKKPHKLDRCIRQITKESLLREERYNYKSVIWLQEASLMADNMDFNNIDRNIELSLWCKLIAHMTRGGYVFIDTQAILDLHYSFKRNLSSYIYIQKRLDFWLFAVLYVREMINTENGNNNFTDDVDTTTRKIILFRWWYKRYDRYEFSYLTDDLNKSDVQFKAKNGLVSFNPKYIEHSDKRIKVDSQESTAICEVKDEVCTDNKEVNL